MKKHLPWVVVLGVTLVVLAALHFMVFSPLTRKHEEVNQDMADGVKRLRDRIELVKWRGDIPDPRKPSFSWPNLLQEVEGTYEEQLDYYQGLVQTIDVGMVEYPEDQTIDLLLNQLRTLQGMEEQHTSLHVLEKWDLSTVARGGFTGRGLDLRFGGYRSFAAEDRLKGQQGTLQFAINMEPWYVPDVAQFIPDTLPRQVLFHGGKQRERPESMPDSVHPGFSSEILIERIGWNLMATIRRSMGPGRSQPGSGDMASADSIDLYPLLTDTAGKPPWKTLRFTWGSNPGEVRLYLDNQPSFAINEQARIKRAQDAALLNAAAAAARAPVAGAGFGGGYMSSEYSPRRELRGGAAMGARPGIPQAGVVLESLEGFSVGVDLEAKDGAPLVFDSMKIWDAIGGTSEPSQAPLFSEEFEHPFGGPEEFDRSIQQLIRFHANWFDPHNEKPVQDQYAMLYRLQIGFAGLQGTGAWSDSLRLLAFLEYAGQVNPRYADMDRLAKQLSLSIPHPDTRKHTLVFLELATDLLEGLLQANVESVDTVQFLNWSNTPSDEPLKKEFKAAFEELQADVQSAGAMGMMGMMGMGYGMGYGDSYGGGYDSYSREDETPEEREKRLEEKKKKDAEAKEKQEEDMKKYMELEDNKKKLEIWKQYVARNEVAPDYYITYRERMAGQGKDYYVRYSLKTKFLCGKEKLAAALYALEFGKRLAFLSQLGLEPNPVNKQLLNVSANVEYNFMRDVSLDLAGLAAGATATQGQPPAPGVPPPSSSAGAGL